MPGRLYVDLGRCRSPLPTRSNPARWADCRRIESSIGLAIAPKSAEPHRTAASDRAGHMTLRDDTGHIVMSRQERLSQWTRQYAIDDPQHAYLYQSGALIGVPVAPDVTHVQRFPIGEDDSWGYVFHAATECALHTTLRRGRAGHGRRRSRRAAASACRGRLSLTRGKTMSSANVNSAETAKFDSSHRAGGIRTANRGPLHDLNPVRLGYMAERVESQEARASSMSAAAAACSAKRSRARARK